MNKEIIKGKEFTRMTEDEFKDWLGKLEEGEAEDRGDIIFSSNGKDYLFIKI